MELEKRYDNVNECFDKIQDPSGLNCTIDFQTIDSKIEGPVYVYYQLDNFYQNHRRYVKSRDNTQLAGTYLGVDDLQNTCDPIIKVGDLWTNQQFSLKKDEGGNAIALNVEDPATPCGLVAKSFFNDTFRLYRQDNDGKKVEIEIIQRNIAWSSDIQYKFKNVDGTELPAGKTYEDVQWLDMTDGKLQYTY